MSVKRPAFSRVRALREQIDASLRTRISDGTWPPGHRFGRAELAAEFGLSNGGVTEALSPVLRALREEGLTESRPNIGLRVTVPGQTWQAPAGYENTPLDEYIEIQLRRRLRDGRHGRGKYRPGAPFPTQDLLADEFGVSAATVRRATKDLAAEGIVVGRTRKYISDKLAQLSDEEIVKEPTRRKPGKAPLVAFREWKTLANWVRDERCRVNGTVLYACYSEGWHLEAALTTPLRQARRSGGLRDRNRTPAQPRVPAPRTLDQDCIADDYTRAKAAVLARISDGTLQAGTVIDQTDLGLRAGASAESVLSALNDLAELRKVELHPGIGYAVTDTTPARHPAGPLVGTPFSPSPAPGPVETP
ncbi:GntR family transcriptional regulator [Streptomyces sp. NPDC094468]|uniref:GntR family transcriptional regulator n=1 Tax=Streptomyces sp. NPDC094468 TaxID=3366066 RepID=UPI003808F88C